MKRPVILIAALVLFATLAIALRSRQKPKPPDAASSATDTTEPRPTTAPAVAKQPALAPRAVHTDAGTQRPSQSPATSGARALAEIRALVDQGHIGAARVRAEHALQEIPDGPEARQIMSLTGVHPHP